MVRQDLIINGVLLVAILGVAYLFGSYEIERKKAPIESSVPGDVGAGPTESGIVRPAIAPVDRSIITQTNPFRTIITPTPTPTPTPLPTPPPPNLTVAMQQLYTLVMLDPPRSVTLQDKSPAQQQFDWKAGETRQITFGGQPLDVTLKSVDPNEFKALFVAPPGQQFSWGFFGK